MVDLISAHISRALCGLAQQAAATPGELNNKFRSEGGSFELGFGQLSAFHGGLDGLVGPPQPDVEEVQPLMTLDDYPVPTDKDLTGM